MKMTGRNAGLPASVAVKAVVKALAAGFPLGSFRIVSATVARYFNLRPPKTPLWRVSNLRGPSLAHSLSGGQSEGDGGPGGGVAPTHRLTTVATHASIAMRRRFKMRCMVAQ